jgi:protein-disulfide isomerase
MFSIESLRAYLLQNKMLLIAILAVALALLGLYAISRESDSDPNAPRPELNVREDDWVIGDPTTAKAVLVEYSDFECPACGIYHSILGQLKAETGNDLAIVYRHFPLSAIHPNAMLAAHAAEAAGQQGKFFEMHDKLFINQKDWAGRDNAADIFKGYASELGLDTDQFTEDMGSSRIAKKVSESVEEARSLGLRGTPSFFLNGVSIPPVRTYAEFRQSVMSRVYKE